MLAPLLALLVCWCESKLRQRGAGRGLWFTGPVPAGSGGAGMGPSAARSCCDPRLALVTSDRESWKCLYLHREGVEAVGR